MTKYLVTGASGHLGRLVVDHLSTLVDKSDIIAMVRSDDAAARYAGIGIATRRADYDDPQSLKAAFDGVDRLLLISSSEVGKREQQHANVIDAAVAAGVGFVAYTSLLGAAESPLLLAKEHAATEQKLAASGLAYTLLRNGWYTENLSLALPQSLDSGQYYGAARDGRLSAATRRDFAEAAAAVLAGGHDGETLELAGDNAFTLNEFAETVSNLTGKPVAYVDLPRDAYKDGLVSAGVPEPFAEVLADSDAGVAEGHLFDDSKALSNLIGRPTTPLADVIRTNLA